MSRKKQSNVLPYERINALSIGGDSLKRFTFHSPVYQNMDFSADVS